MKKSLLKFIFCLFACTTTVYSVFAYDVDKIVSPVYLEELKKNGKIEKNYFNKENVELSLIPDTELAQSAKKFWPSSKEKPVYVAEELYYMKKSDIGQGTITIDKASKVIRSISKMEGMEYYSHSAKKNEILYKECYRTSGPLTKDRLEDDTEGNADGKVFYCLQNDNSFGKTNYRLEYHQSKNETSAGFVCTTPIYMGPIKAIDKDNLRISVVISDCGDSVLVYMLVQAKIPTIGMFKQTMDDSFSARLDAIYKWFVKQF